MRHRFHLVDVFAEQRYAGNPLVVIVGSEALPAETMQRLATETQCSETTFVDPVPGADGGYRVRIFTPAREIAFAGHPIFSMRIEQGHHLGRPSLIRLRGRRVGPEPAIGVGGTVIPTVRGELV